MLTLECTDVSKNFTAFFFGVKQLKKSDRKNEDRTILRNVGGHLAIDTA